MVRSTNHVSSVTYELSVNTIVLTMTKIILKLSAYPIYQQGFFKEIDFNDWVCLRGIINLLFTYFRKTPNDQICNHNPKIRPTCLTFT